MYKYYVLLPCHPCHLPFLQGDVRGEAYQELLSPWWGNMGWAVVSGLASCCHHLGVRRAAGLEGEPAGIATVPGCHDRGFLAASLQLFCVPSRWKQLVAALAVVTGVVQFVVAAAVVGSCVCVLEMDVRFIGPLQMPRLQGARRG